MDKKCEKTGLLLSATPGFCLDSICYRLSLTCASQYILGFVHIKFLQFIASRSKILTRIEFFGLRPQYSSHGGCHRQTTVGIDIDLANRRFGCLAELLFGNADRVFQFAAIFVDFIHILLRNGRRAMKYNGKSRYTFFYFFQYIETQRRRNQSAVFVARTLLGFKFIGAMRSSNGNCQRIHSRTTHKSDHLIGIGLGMVFGFDIIFDTGQYTQFAFNGNIKLVGIIDNFLRQFHIFVVGQMRTVDHYR